MTDHATPESATFASVDVDVVAVSCGAGVGVVAGPLRSRVGIAES